MNISKYAAPRHFLFSLLLLVGISFQSQAALISFSPSSQAVDFGANASVDLVISGLGDDILTGFDIEIGFDDSLLQFVSFDVPSPTTELDPFGLDGGYFSYGLDLGGGLAAVGDLSLEYDETLNGTADDFFAPFHPNGEQANSFVLGTLNFLASAVNQGTSSLDITYSLLGGGYDADFNVVALDATTESGSIAVSEPSTLLLFTGGLIGLGIARKKRSS